MCFCMYFRESFKIGTALLKVCGTGHAAASQPQAPHLAQRSEIPQPAGGQALAGEGH